MTNYYMKNALAILLLAPTSNAFTPNLHGSNSNQYLNNFGKDFNDNNENLYSNTVF